MEASKLLIFFWGSKDSDFNNLCCS